MGMRHSWKRILGLSSRGLIVTAQRFLDIFTVLTRFWTDTITSTTVCLLLCLVLTTGLTAVTMQKHWSVFKQNRPYGTKVGVIAAVLQIAPLWEIADKVMGHDRPHGALLPSSQRPLLQNESPQTRSPSSPLQSHPAKGSPGENVMRGVRKLTIVNLPQALLSVWIHLRDLVPVTGDYVLASKGIHLQFAFTASFVCLVFGIADIVLYIWVHDGFVRKNKKLVTFHYCFELMSRVPVVVAFHVTYSRMYGYWPTCALIVCDTLATSLLLLLSRFSTPKLCCDRHTFFQFLYSLCVAVPLFLVNVVFFDPGMIFFYINQVFYLIKYVELYIMMQLIWDTNFAGIDFLEDKASVFLAFAIFEITVTGLSALIVWVIIPRLRKLKDRGMSIVSSISKASVRLQSEGSGSPRIVTLRGEGGPILERLEEIFEMLGVLSTAKCSRNRSQLLNLIVNELWLHVLNWNGTFCMGSGGFVRASYDPPSRIVTFVPQGSDTPASSNFSVSTSLAAAWRGVVLEGAHIVVPMGPQGVRSGFFDGRRLYWDDGEVWTRHSEFGESLRSEAHTVLRLILPQLTLALRWETFSSSGASNTVGLGTSPKGVMLCAGSAPADDGVSGGAGCRPLLGFLIQYALTSRQTDIVSDLYWNLVCLSHEGGGGCFEDPHGYRSARQELLRMLQAVHMDGVCGPAGQEYPAAVHDEELSQFMQSARVLLRGQRGVWRQKMELLTKHSGRASGGGSWAYRTEKLRAALRGWSDIREKSRNTWEPDMDELHLDSPDLGSGAGGSAQPPQDHIDLVSPGPHVSLPIDPNVSFRGVVIEESEVIASKQAPLLLSCKVKKPGQGSTNLPTPGIENDRLGAPVKSRSLEALHVKCSRENLVGSDGGVDSGEEKEVTRERYLLKVGDDLRQDQLMLQIMALMCCVWQERLPTADAKLLQLANFRVLAITPSSGYVKFVPDAVPLSGALHQSQGDLGAWLERNRPEHLSFNEVMDTFCGSVAASCVVTYILGIGDRHLENICVTRSGQFFHVDFSFVLGDDPKPCAPQVRLPQQVAQALLKNGRLSQCFSLASKAYLELRHFAGLWSSILQLTAAAGGAGCTKLTRNASAAVAGVRERLRVDEADDERAASEFLGLMRESSEGLASILIDKVHAAGLFWR